MMCMKDSGFVHFNTAALTLGGFPSFCHWSQQIKTRNKALITFTPEPLHLPFLLLYIFILSLLVMVFCQMIYNFSHFSTFQNRK